MSTVIFNPTNETFIGTYVGEDTTIEPGAKVKVDDARANHFLNKFDRRGLIPLDYGDEGEAFEKKVKAALAKNKEFKEKCVGAYNQSNLYRKAQNLEYQQPPEQIQEYARELGIKLIQPYMPDDMETPRMRELENENKSKDRQITDMQGQINELSSMLQRFITDQQAQASSKKPGPRKGRTKKTGGEDKGPDPTEDTEAAKETA